MTETGGVAEEFAKGCKGLGAELASGEGVDEGGGIGWVWGLASGVWGGWRSDGAQAVVAGLWGQTVPTPGAGFAASSGSGGR